MKEQVLDYRNNTLILSWISLQNWRKQETNKKTKLKKKMSTVEFLRFFFSPIYRREIGKNRRWKKFEKRTKPWTSERECSVREERKREILTRIEREVTRPPRIASHGALSLQDTSRPTRRSQTSRLLTSSSTSTPFQWHHPPASNHSHTIFSFLCFLFLCSIINESFLSRIVVRPTFHSLQASKRIRFLKIYVYSGAVIVLD